MRRLLIRPGAIGDFIVSLPAMECLRTAWTEVWTRSETLSLARFADRARPIASTGLDLLGITDRPDPALIERLRGFDSIVSWYGSNRPEFRTLVRELGLPFTFFPALPPAGAGSHAADYYLEQARHLAPCGSDGVPRIACPEASRRGAVIHPFAASARKRWHLGRFREVAARIAMPVEWCAGPEDDLPGAIRIGDLYQLACRLAAAEVYIGNDSGISHLAAAAGTPVVALFGPTDPAVWAPRGPRVAVIARAAMEEIGVEDVLTAVTDIAGR